MPRLAARCDAVMRLVGYKKGSQADTKSQGVYPLKDATATISGYLEIVNAKRKPFHADR